MQKSNSGNYCVIGVIIAFIGVIIAFIGVIMIMQSQYRHSYETTQDATFQLHFILKIFQTTEVQKLQWQCHRAQISTFSMTLELLNDDLPYFYTIKFHVIVNSRVFVSQNGIYCTLPLRNRYWRIFFVRFTFHCHLHCSN